MTAEEYVELDSDLISASLPTEEEILEEFLVDEGVLQQMQVSAYRRNLQLKKILDTFVI